MSQGGCTCSGQRICKNIDCANIGCALLRGEQAHFAKRRVVLVRRGGAPRRTVALEPPRGLHLGPSRRRRAAAAAQRVCKRAQSSARRPLDGIVHAVCAVACPSVCLARVRRQGPNVRRRAALLSRSADNVTLLREVTRSRRPGAARAVSTLGWVPSPERPSSSARSTAVLPMLLTDHRSCTSHAASWLGPLLARTRCTLRASAVAIVEATCANNSPGVPTRAIHTTPARCHAACNYVCSKHSCRSGCEEHHATAPWTRRSIAPRGRHNAGRPMTSHGRAARTFMCRQRLVQCACSKVKAPHSAQLSSQAQGIFSGLRRCNLLATVSGAQIV